MNTYNKIEIIIAEIHLDRLIDRLEALGVKGYTTLKIDKSMGPKKGKQQMDGLLSTSHNSLFFTITKVDDNEKIIQDIQPFLKRRGGLLMIYPITYISGLQTDAAS